MEGALETSSKHNSRLVEVFSLKSEKKQVGTQFTAKKQPNCSGNKGLEGTLVCISREKKRVCRRWDHRNISGVSFWDVTGRKL